MMNSRNSRNALLIFLGLLPFLCFSHPQSQTCFRNCRTDTRGYDLIKRFEGYSPFIYKDVAGIPTVGFGHAIRSGEDIIEPLMGPDAQTLLESDVRATEEAVNTLLAQELTLNQFDALISFSYNVGVGTLKRSTLLKKVNEPDMDSVPAQFIRYVYAGGEKSRGLLLRRRMEAQVFSDQ